MDAEKSQVIDTLTSVSPIDGRYYNHTRNLLHFFSEYGYFKYRLYIELKYLIFMNKTLNIVEPEDCRKLIKIYTMFNVKECKLIKKHEEKCNHDVKSIEYYLIDKIKQEYPHLEKLIPYIHYALTSQDINNTGLTLSIKDYIKEHYFHNLQHIVNIIENHVINWINIIMIGRTHGQPAVPTSLGKEFNVFRYRLQKEMKILDNIKYYAKFSGAVGNLSAHYLSYPDIQWSHILNEFTENDLDLKRNQFTTQIDNYENLSVLFDCIRRINTILIDMIKDIWTYISMDYLKQSFVPGEVGSSTMPQKINPINFENAEGNLLIANTLLDFKSNKLPVSRLQRDLTDSTIIRNIGTIFGHIQIAFNNIIIGLHKIEPNTEKIKFDLDNNYSVLMEYIQTVLRREDVPDAYEKIKALSRGKNINTREDYVELINGLDVNESIKVELKLCSPTSYGLPATFPPVKID